MVVNNINFYSDNASSLSELYNSVSFAEVHKNWIEYIPLSGKVLDIGCGNGRDCAYMASLGLDTTGIEPSELLNMAKSNHPNLKWINDTLPFLDTQYYPHSDHPKYSYDLILCSAVWMHIQPEHRIMSLDYMIGLLADNGSMVLTLRYGGFTDGRISYDINIDQIKTWCYTLGLKYNIISSVDCMGRNNVRWETMIINKAR